MFEKTYNYVLIILFSLSFMIAYGQRNQIMDRPKVDERIEMLSIVFRLAGNQEYSSVIFKRYVDRINEHYGPFKEHELITFVNKIKNENGIGYDAVMSMAVHLDDKFNLKQKNIDETLDKRWSRANDLQFATLLKKFYKDSNSKRFFQDNQALYNEVQRRFLPIYEHIELDWYPKFYGKKPSENFDCQRDKYPTLESYMPVLAEAYQSYATNISSLDETFEERRPKIISFEGIQDGQTNVNSKLGVLKINFDRPLLGHGRSFRV